MIRERRHLPRHQPNPMPTPLGHALGGIAAGALVAGRAVPPVSLGRRRVPVLAVCGLCGMLPDVDFLLGGHRGMTHTVGAALAVGVLIAVVDRRPTVWLAAATAYGTHVLLDWLGTDTVAPIGVMALWPFDQGLLPVSLSLVLAGVSTVLARRVLGWSGTSRFGGSCWYWDPSRWRGYCSPVARKRSK